MFRNHSSKRNKPSPRNKTIKKSPIVKLLDMRHANLGDRLASIMAYDFLGSLGIPVCGGDLDELRAAKDVEATHLLVWGGGTIYETEKGTDGPIHSWNLLLDSRKMKTLFVGPGFNGIAKETPINVIRDWKRVLDDATLVSLRDRESIEECQKTFGVIPDNRYHHYPEISFLCNKYIDLRVPKIPDLVAYSVTSSYFKLEDQIQMTKTLSNQGMRILFFPHSDDDYNYYLENNLVETNDYLINLRESPIAALQLLASASIQVTARLHGMIMSIISGTPFIHVNANMLKIYWQLEEINMTDYPYIYENPNRGLLNNYSVLDLHSFGDIVSSLKNDTSIRDRLLQVAKDAAVGAEEHLRLTKDILLG